MWGALDWERTEYDYGRFFMKVRFKVSRCPAAPNVQPPALPLIFRARGKMKNRGRTNSGRRAQTRCVANVPLAHNALGDRGCAATNVEIDDAEHTPARWIPHIGAMNPMRRDRIRFHASLSAPGGIKERNNRRA